MRHAHTSDRVGVMGSVESNSTISVCAGIVRTGKGNKTNLYDEWAGAAQV